MRGINRWRNNRYSNVFRFRSGAAAGVKVHSCSVEDNVEHFKRLFAAWLRVDKIDTTQL